MPHETLRLLPGVDVNRTTALNEAGISTCQLIRSVLDRQGQALVQKLGGWTRFFPLAMPSLVRALCAWQGANDAVQRGHLAVGCETAADPSVGATLAVITSGAYRNITPLVRKDDVAPDATTAAGSAVVELGDTGSNISDYVSVFVQTHISVGGIIIFGFYQCYAVGANSFEIHLADQFGTPILAPSTETNAGTVAEFATTVGSSAVDVTLADHGYEVGDIYPVLVATTVGGITLSGEYQVQSVTSADVFVIFASNQAASSATEEINGGDVRYDFYLAYGAQASGAGYGVGPYGGGAYGSGVTPTPPTGDPIDTDSWALDNFGELLVVCPTGTTFGSPDGTTAIGGPIYMWSSNQNNPTAFVLNQGPVSSSGAFVAMPQQQIVAWGTTFNGVQDPLLLRWCDVSNPAVWVGQPDNQAGSRRLSRGSRIVAGIQGPQQGLIWTDLGLWTMQYIGPPNIYGLNEVGTGCGLIAPKAVGVLGNDVFWMAPKQFFQLAGQGPEVLYCPIWDVVFQDLDTDRLDNIRFAGNSLFNEVAWHFTSTNSADGENDMYVKYNKLLGPQAGWDYGMLDDNLNPARTAWIDQSVLGQPIGADTSLLLQQHETSLNADGQAMVSSFQTGYFVLTNADVLLVVDQFWPDAKWGLFNGVANATLMLTFYVKEYPADEPRVYGPYMLTEAVKWITPGPDDGMGFRGRLVSLKFESSDVDSFWRLGAMRYRYAPDGRFL